MRIAQVYDIPFAHNKATADFIVNSTLMDEEYDHDVINFKQNIKQRAEAVNFSAIELPSMKNARPFN